MTKSEIPVTVVDTRAEKQKRLKAHRINTKLSELIAADYTKIEATPRSKTTPDFKNDVWLNMHGTRIMVFDSEALLPLIEEEADFDYPHIIIVKQTSPYSTADGYPYLIAEATKEEASILRTFITRHLSTSVFSHDYRGDSYETLTDNQVHAFRRAVVEVYTSFIQRLITYGIIREGFQCTLENHLPDIEVMRTNDNHESNLDNEDSEENEYLLQNEASIVNLVFPIPMEAVIPRRQVTRLTHHYSVQIKNKLGMVNLGLYYLHSQAHSIATLYYEKLSGSMDSNHLNLADPSTRIQCALIILALVGIKHSKMYDQVPFKIEKYGKPNSNTLTMYLFLKMLSTFIHTGKIHLNKKDNKRIQRMITNKTVNSPTTLAKTDFYKEFPALIPVFNLIDQQ